MQVLPTLSIVLLKYYKLFEKLVQGNVDNSITEGEEKRKIVASSCTGPGLSSESENTPLLH